MTRPLLPPRGVFVPTRMLYHSPLPPLRGLAWGREVTPPLRMQDLAALTGKCPATLYKDMSLLRSIPALSWRSTGPGTIIVPFAAKLSDLEYDPELLSPIPDSQNPDSWNLESKNLESSHPLKSSR